MESVVSEDDYLYMRDAERNLSGWFGWLADDDPELRQFAARMASVSLADYGLVWADIARIAAREVVARRRRTTS
jgi:hypothetical protein